MREVMDVRLPHPTLHVLFAWAKEIERGDSVLFMTLAAAWLYFRNLPRSAPWNRGEWVLCSPDQPFRGFFHAGDQFVQIAFIFNELDLHDSTLFLRHQIGSILAHELKIVKSPIEMNQVPLTVAQPVFDLGNSLWWGRRWSESKIDFAGEQGPSPACI